MLVRSAAAGGLLSTGVVSVAGCTLNIRGSGLLISEYGYGQFNVSSGLVLTTRAVLGIGSGILAINGGTFASQQYLLIGVNSCGISFRLFSCDLNHGF
jgi:hypothetical protein